MVSGAERSPLTPNSTVDYILSKEEKQKSLIDKQRCSSTQ